MIINKFILYLNLHRYCSNFTENVVCSCLARLASELLINIMKFLFFSSHFDILCSFQNSVQRDLHYYIIHSMNIAPVCDTRLGCMRECSSSVTNLHVVIQLGYVRVVRRGQYARLNMLIWNLHIDLWNRCSMACNCVPNVNIYIF